MFQTKVVEEIKKHILFSMFFFSPLKSCLYENVEKGFTVGQATDNNMAHVQCMLDN